MRETKRPTARKGGKQRERGKEGQKIRGRREIRERAKGQR